MRQFKKGDIVTHILHSPKVPLVVKNYKDDRVLCKWMTADGENEGLFVEEKLRKIQKPV